MPKFNLIKGSELKLILKKKKVSQKDLCEALGYNQATASRYFTDNLSLSAQFLVDVMIYAKIGLREVIEKGVVVDIAPHLLAAETQEIYGTEEKASTIKELRSQMRMIERRLSELESMPD